MVVDTVACVGCSACVLACRNENDVPEGCSRRWVNQVVRGSFPELKMEVWSESCQQCSDAPCVANCPTGASYVDPATGTVQVKRELCTGCKACMASCPYNARYIHPDGFVDKCTLCNHRLKRGEQTACESVCPTSAIAVGDLNDSQSRAARLLRLRGSKQLRTAAGTRPKFSLLV
jgi:Fe-S-cluster-containing dehydrogenase component